MYRSQIESVPGHQYLSEFDKVDRCVDAAGMPMAVCILIFPDVAFDVEGCDCIMARFFIELPVC